MRFFTSLRYVQNDIMHFSHALLDSKGAFFEIFCG